MNELKPEITNDNSAAPSGQDEQRPAQGAIAHHDPHDEPMPEGEEVAPPGAAKMAIVRWVLVGLMAIAAVATLGHYFGLFAGVSTAQAAERWQCPMHPGVIQDHPGECPICGMDLVKIVDANAMASGHAASAPEHAGHEAVVPEHVDQSIALPAGHEGHRHDPADPYFCPMHPEETAIDPKARCPLCKMKLSKREEAALPAGHEGHRHNPDDPYFCPMHPEETAIDPKARCPLCKMKLSKREAADAGQGHEGHASSGGSASEVPGTVPIMLSPERIQLTGLRTAKVERQTLKSEIRTVGTIAADESKLARIQTRFSGWIEQLMVAETGQRVSKGQVLATLYSPELYTAQQELLSAKRWTEGGPNAQSLTAGLQEDARRKLELFGISPQEIAAIEKAGEPQRALKIRSPVDGYVVGKAALQGLFVQPGTELFQIADLSRVWLLADVYENDIAQVHVGQQARLELASYPGKPFAGKVDLVYPSLDSDTRTLRVRLAFKNPGLELKPGMYGDVTLAAREAEALVLPREAVIDTGTEQYVFVALTEGRFEPRRVQLGTRSGEQIEALSGVSEGETVVTTGNFLIDSESRLRAAIEGMGGPAPAHAGHEHGQADGGES